MMTVLGTDRSVWLTDPAWGCSHTTGEPRRCRLSARLTGRVTLVTGMWVADPPESASEAIVDVFAANRSGEIVDALYRP